MTLSGLPIVEGPRHYRKCNEDGYIVSVASVMVLQRKAEFFLQVDYPMLLWGSEGYGIPKGPFTSLSEAIQCAERILSMHGLTHVDGQGWSSSNPVVKAAKKFNTAVDAEWANLHAKPAGSRRLDFYLSEDKWDALVRAVGLDPHDHDNDEVLDRAIAAVQGAQHDRP